MRKKPLSELQLVRCSRFAMLRKRLGITQLEMANALRDFTEREGSSAGRIANWEYGNAPIPSGIWKRLPTIFSKALESKRGEVASALALLASIEAEWNAETPEALLVGSER